MSDPVVQLANEAFGCIMQAYFLFAGFLFIGACVAVFLQFYWYGGW